jgi:phage-related protein
MFEQALKTVMGLPETRRESLLDRLQDVQASGQGMGWGVEYAFNDLWQRDGLEFDN